MIRNINEKARRALKKSLMLGGAMLFVTAVAGCDELSSSSSAGSLTASLSPKASTWLFNSNHNETMLRDELTSIDRIDQ